jgi:hypothetical protein
VWIVVPGIDVFIKDFLIPFFHYEKVMEEDGNDCIGY